MSHQYVNEFQDSMNEHPRAEYRAITGKGCDTGQGYVIENERDYKGRGHLRVWQRPESNPRSNEWGKVYDEFGTWEETKETFRSISSKEDVEEISEGWTDETKI